MAVGGLQNTISSNDISEEATYHVADVISEYGIIKRYYRCNQETAICLQNKQSKSRQNTFQNCSGNILITYFFPGEEMNIKPCKNI